MRPSIRPALVFVSVILGALTVSARGMSYDHTDDDNFREDVLQCEDAVAKLASCCPDMPPTISCNYYFHEWDHTGCDGTGDRGSTRTEPDLSPGDSERIRASTCPELHDSPICARAHARTLPVLRW